jgi:hypothetical protein
MKFVIRFFALSVVAAAAVAATVTPKTSVAVPSHISATASMPTPARVPFTRCCVGVN